MNGADVWMIQRGRCSGLLKEPDALLLGRGELVGKKLQGDNPIEGNILSFVHHPHATFAKLLQDPVVGDSFADHSSLPLSQVPRFATLDSGLDAVHWCVGEAHKWRVGRREIYL